MNTVSPGTDDLIIFEQVSSFLKRRRHLSVRIRCLLAQQRYRDGKLFGWPHSHF